jgi:CelD/BcsL family acetyltransferase involved in cellulose biosynthesis
MSLRVTPFRGLDGLRQLELAWRTINNHAPGAYYLDFDWFLTLCRHAYGRDREEQPHFFLVEEFGRHLAIVPLELRTEPIRRIPTRIWSLLGSRISDVFITVAAADFPCVDKAHAAAALDAVRVFLASFRPRASLLLIGRALDLSAAGVAASRLSGCLAHDFQRAGVDVLDTAQSFDSLLSNLAGKFRRNLRARWRALAAEGVLSFEVCRRGDQQFDAAFTELLEVEASGWKGTTGTGTALNQNVMQREFLLDLNRGSGNVCPEIYMLRLGTTCIAAQYWLRTPNGLANLKMGYDETMRRFSPGHQLLAHVLEHACAEPALESVSLVSHQEWHADWCPTVLPHRWSYFHLGTPASRLRSMLFALPTRAAIRA